MAFLRPISRNFPRADLYRAISQPVPRMVREKHSAHPFLYTERHLKCVWFDPAWRPAGLRTAGGEAVIVEHPGRWNLEAGPDFLEAVLKIGTEKRRLTGAIEVHIHPGDWSAHEHAANPAYRNVIAHVAYFSGYLPAGALPRGAVQIALKDRLAANPCFSFDALDLTAYPYARHTLKTPCAAILAAWEPDRIAAGLEAAGEERLRRKTERLACALTEKEPDQVLYEEIMGALGYKQNRAPFRLLAERCPLAALRELSGLKAVTAYALLMGIGGLLPPQTESRWDAETRAFVRHLWNNWWKYQSQWSSRILPREAWTLHNLRPPNHPQRRLMAAALLFTQKKSLAQSLQAVPVDPATEWLKRVTRMLQPATAGYWQYRLSFSGQRQADPISLTGSLRAAAMISNVIIPFLAALGTGRGFSAEILRQLPAEEDNRLIRQTARDLLGADHNPALYRIGLRQQGLIQFSQDFCLNDRSGCTDCALPGLLNSFQQEHHEPAPHDSI